MGPLNKESIYDIIWVEPDKCHYMIARPDNFYENSEPMKKIREEYFTIILPSVASGGASTLTGTNACMIKLEEVISNQVDNHNQWYEEFLKNLPNSEEI